MPVNEPGAEKLQKPKITDNDKETISIAVDGKDVVSWCYSSRDERGEKMRCAHYWCDGFKYASDTSPRYSEDSSHAGVEKWRGIVEGLKLVTSGEWDADHMQSDGITVFGVLTDNGFLCDTLNADYRIVDVVRESDGEGDYEDIDMQGMYNMRHIARCSPNNILEVDSYVSSLKARIDRLERDNRKLIAKRLIGEVKQEVALENENARLIRFLTDIAENSMFSSKERIVEHARSALQSGEDQ